MFKGRKIYNTIQVEVCCPLCFKKKILSTTRRNIDVHNPILMSVKQNLAIYSSYCWRPRCTSYQYCKCWLFRNLLKLRYPSNIKRVNFFFLKYETEENLKDWLLDCLTRSGHTICLPSVSLIVLCTRHFFSFNNVQNICFYI